MQVDRRVDTEHALVYGSCVAPGGVFPVGGAVTEVHD